MTEPAANIAANPLPGWLARFCSRWRRVCERYLSLDPRSLGLVRIYLGCLLLVDLLRRLPHLHDFYSNEGPLPNHVPLGAIPEHLDQDDTWCDYTAIIAGRGEYHGTLAHFIRDYPRRTRKKADRIVSFEVWLLEDDSPPPGQSQPTNPTRTLIFKE